jgi:enoyl-CoA hydratase
MSSTLICLEIEGPHATITFASDDGGLNMLTQNALHTLGAHVARLRAEPSVRTLTLRAEGKVFIAGGDIRELTTFDAAQARDYATLGTTVMTDLASLPCITAAAIQGAAIGGGFEIALACDFRLAVRSAKVGFTEVSLGLLPSWGGIGRLNKIVGMARAKRMVLSAMPMTAEDVADWGLVDEVVNSPEDLHARAKAFCNSFYRAAPQAVALAKRAARDFDDLGAFVECFQGREAREGLAAFVEKRPARWME